MAGMGSRNLFDGPGAGVVAKVMARQNRAAEAEAVELLDPNDSDRVLVIGFGPGVGVQLLLERLARGGVGGVDPSRAMLRQATARNRDALDSGRLELVCASSDAMPWPEHHFDGAIAVNVMQLCEPIEATATELARLLRPGARLVSLTHDWAIRKHAATVDAWLADTKRALSALGFIDVGTGRGRAESGTIVRLTARRGDRT
jgi:ubiquinone/menaquinone biosynthesis C-methylase UbiE